MLGFYERLYQNYGDIVRFEVAGEEAYLLAHPEYIEHVLVADDAKFLKGDVVNRSLGSALGEGMLLAEGDEWRSRRTLAQPAFYHERVVTYGESMVAYTAEASENWDRAVINVQETMTNSRFQSSHERCLESTFGGASRSCARWPRLHRRAPVRPRSIARRKRRRKSRTTDERAPATLRAPDEQRPADDEDSRCL